MNTESFYLYDREHWRHIVAKNHLEKGETVYNADNRSLPVKKTGAAPCEFLGLCYTWHTAEDIIEDLQARGFRKINKALWIKEV